MYILRFRQLNTEEDEHEHVRRNHTHNGYLWCMHAHVWFI